MIRNASMAAILVAVLGMPLAASASFMDDLPVACQASLLTRRIAFLHCSMGCSHLAVEQQAACSGSCLQRNAYRSAFVLSRPTCSEARPLDSSYDCSTTSGMCTCEGATDAASSCIKLVLDAKCASALTCTATECVCISA